MDKTLGQIVVGVINEISVYFITFISSLAFLVFIWGITKYLFQGGSQEARRRGKDLMIWGLIGLFVMFGVWGIVGVIGNTFGVSTVVPQFEAPSASESFPTPSMDTLGGSGLTGGSGTSGTPSGTPGRTSGVRSFWSRFNPTSWFNRGGQ